MLLYVSLIVLLSGRYLANFCSAFLVRKVDRKFVFCFVFYLTVYCTVYSARQPAGNYFQTCLLEHRFISFVEQILLLPHPFLKCCPVLLRSFSVLLRTRHAKKLTFKIATNSLSLLCQCAIGELSQKWRPCPALFK